MPRKPVSAMTWGRLWFTKSEDLDLGYAFLIPFLALALVSWVLAALKIWSITAVMWSFLGSVISIMLLATIPRDRARILKDATLPGSIAQGIAEGAMGDMYGDERGEYTTPEPLDAAEHELG